MLRAAGSHLGSLAGRDLAARCAEGRLDARGQAASRARRKRALTARVVVAVGGGDHPDQRGPVPARRAEPARRAGEPAGPGPQDRGAARRSGGRAGPGGRAGTRPRPSGTPRTSAAGRCGPGWPGPSGGWSGDGAGDAGRAGAAAQAGQPRRRRADRAAMAGAVGGGPAVPDRRRREGQGVGQRDDPVATRTRAGWSSSSPPRWRTWRTGRTAGTGCRARWSSPTGATRSPPRPPPAPSATTSACDPASGRWYLDASWKTAPGPAPSLEELRRHPVVAVDVNAGHLAVAVVAADGNVTRHPGHGAAGPGRAARRHPRRAAAGRGQRPHRHRQASTARGRS